MKQYHFRTPLIALTLLGITGGGCARAPHTADLSSLYNRAAQTEDLERNPVIVIPGILGSRLVDGDSGTVVWGSFAGDFADPTTPDGAQLAALPLGEGVDLKLLKDGVQPNGVLGRLRLALLGLPIELNAYYNILEALGAGGYRDEERARSGAVDYGSDHFTCFQFAYDWRRDISESAVVLHQFILAKRDLVQRKLAEKHGTANHDVKFDIIAHSMGGLVTAYYLRYGPTPLPADGSLPPLTWEGAKFIERVVMIGTPNAGSLQALKELTEGVQFAPVVPKYEAAVLGTMPAIYQLLPRTRHRPVILAEDESRPVDLYDPAVWISHNWGLADPDQEDVLAALLPTEPDSTRRREIALEHLGKVLARARQFSLAVDAPAIPPEHLSFYLIAGDAEPTAAVASVEPQSGRLKVLVEGPGDGTVLRSSALLDERVGNAWTRTLISPIDWDHVTFLFHDHLELTKDPTFTDNILYLLLEAPHG